MPANYAETNWAKSSTRNLSLAGLSDEFAAKLAPHLSPVALPQGFLLSKPAHPIYWIYFLDRGMASITTSESGGTAIETGIVGREGMVGVSALLGFAETHATAIMQGGGNGYRIRADVLRRSVEDGSEFLRPLHAFIHALSQQTSQLVLCNRLHEVEARLARWLMMARDAMESNSLRLTQEFLAEMLGVGRPAVTIAAGALQRTGAIAYARGHVDILKPELLASLSCECYREIRLSYAQVYPQLFVKTAKL